MFRFFKSRIPLEVSCAKFYEVVDDKIVESRLNVPLPSSCDYSLKDLLAAGVPISPVDSTVVHDASATSSVVNNVLSSINSNSSTDENSL